LHTRRLCPWQALVVLGGAYCAAAYWQRKNDGKKDWLHFADLPAVSVFACVSGKTGVTVTNKRVKFQDARVCVGSWNSVVSHISWELFNSASFACSSCPLCCPYLLLYNREETSLPLLLRVRSLVMGDVPDADRGDLGCGASGGRSLGGQRGQGRVRARGAVWSVGRDTVVATRHFPPRAAGARSGEQQGNHPRRAKLYVCLPPAPCPDMSTSLLGHSNNSPNT
jgi:hypothetical protein